MQEKPNSNLFFFMLFLVQATNSVTGALYLDGNWNHAYLFGGTFLLVLIVQVIAQATIWWNKCKRQETVVSPEANDMPRFTRAGLRTYFIMLGIALAIAVGYWVALYTQWTAPQIPIGFRSCLHAIGAVVTAVAGLLIADGIRAYQRWHREGFAPAQVQAT